MVLASYSELKSHIEHTIYSGLTQKYRFVLYCSIMTTFTLSDKKQNLYSDYCQFLLASFTNFTQTYFADHTYKWNHDQLNRFLRNENIPSSELWKSVEPDIEFDKDGYLIFDDVVLSKIYSKVIEACCPENHSNDLPNKTKFIG